jgi:uncharacterized membrane protein
MYCIYILLRSLRVGRAPVQHYYYYYYYYYYVLLILLLILLLLLLILLLLLLLLLVLLVLHYYNLRVRRAVQHEEQGLREVHVLQRNHGRHRNGHPLL